MRRTFLLLVAAISITAGCAATTPSTTAMEACPPAGCHEAPGGRYANALRDAAARALACAPEALAVRELDPDSVVGPWEVDGCGHRATFEGSRFSLRAAVVRTSPIVADAR